ncbi:Gfo/Idh/MocA family protein [Asanoa iriomotensis]|uniref:Oxidoreductase n=1 Tax=Asanoa iriomotensis TaxID=234613 RepID=A0ABQ4BYX6_9ACTN|nr:Gfo/Idh/MocA family oxidoreductase [Asanoa iriomotensis]GIF55733.1 oxidoreductase [Asanoa iriomotensis]
MSHPVRWGILGAAKIVEAEMGPAMLRSRRNTVRAVASRRLPAAEKLAADLDAPAAYDSYDRLLADPEVDAVYVATPNALHADWAVAALDAGKHVLCEKPMAMSADEVRRMNAAAQRNGRVLMEAFMWRFHPRVERVLDLLAAGAVGDVRLVRSTYTFDLAAAGDVRSGSVDDDLRLNADLGGGVVSDLGAYCVSGLRTYAGGRPVSVHSWKHSAPGRAVETTASGQIAFDNGVTGQFFAALDVPGGGLVEILGTRGRIRMTNAFRIRAAQAPFDIERQHADGSWTTESTPFHDQYEAEIDHFAAVVRDGIPPRITPQDALANALTLDAVRRSWTEGEVTVCER